MTPRPVIEWRCGSEAVLALAYGEEPADLRLPLGDGPGPAVVTALLTDYLRDGRGRPLDHGTVLGWDLSRRLQGLLGIAAASLGRHQVVEARCLADGCGAGLDLAVDLAAFSADEPPVSVVCEPEPGRRLRLRVPTGADQAAWLERWPHQPPEDAGLAASLVESVDAEPVTAAWRPPAEWLAAMGEALAEADPYTDLWLETVCVDCGAPVSVPLDLEEYVLQRLRQRRGRLLDEVHALAAAYHWSEAEIFDLPGDRRRAYLHRVLGGEAW